MLKVGFDGIQHFDDEWSPNRVGDLGTANKLGGEEAHEALSAGPISRGQVGAGELRQHLFRWTPKKWLKVENQLRNGKLLTKNRLEKRVFRREVPINER